MKQCNICKQIKEERQFTKDTRIKSGYRAQCKACTCTYIKKYHGKTPRGRYARLREKAKLKRDFTITATEFVDWWNSQHQVCHYCEQPLTVTAKNKHRLSDLTIDRKDNTQGYSITNIVLACRRCNIMKGEWLTETQTVEIAHKYFNL